MSRCADFSSDFCEQCEVTFERPAVLGSDIGAGSHHLLDGAVGESPVVVLERDTIATLERAACLCGVSCTACFDEADNLLVEIDELLGAETSDIW